MLHQYVGDISQQSKRGLGICVSNRWRIRHGPAIESEIPPRSLKSYNYCRVSPRLTCRSSATCGFGLSLSDVTQDRSQFRGSSSAMARRPAARYLSNASANALLAAMSECSWRLCLSIMRRPHDAASAQLKTGQTSSDCESRESMRGLAHSLALLLRPHHRKAITDLPP
jgi:hypothetical protein